MPISPDFLPRELHYIIPLADQHGSDARVMHYDPVLRRHVPYAERLSAEDVEPLRQLYAKVSARGHIPLIESWYESHRGKGKCPPETTWPIYGLLCLFQQMGSLDIIPFYDGPADARGDQKPFVSLAAARVVDQPGLPADLAAFYSENEGVGRESSPDRLVRLCRLDEVARIGWRNLHVLGSYECPRWESFAALRIGISLYFDEIVYVLSAPACPAGSILTLGVDVSGPGGTGSASLESSLVLAPSFTEWLRHLGECGWIEYGLVPGGLAELPKDEERQLRRYYQALNPAITWGPKRKKGDRE